jgi:hypothetical protein
LVGDISDELLRHNSSHFWKDGLISARARAICTSLLVFMRARFPFSSNIFLYIRKGFLFILQSTFPIARANSLSENQCEKYRARARAMRSIVKLLFSARCYNFYGINNLSLSIILFRIKSPCRIETIYYIITFSN